MSKSLIITLVFSLTFMNLFAQKKDSSKTYTMDESIITASRFEQNPDETGRSISIINQQQLQQAVYTNLGELLAAEAGIQFVGNGQNYGATQRMFIRGSNSYHAIVMIDGVRISDPSSVDNGIDLTEISLENVERIEIVRGSHSTIYGSSAIGGVINIITKKNAINKLNADVNLSVGSFGENSWLSQNMLNLNFNHKSGFYANAGLDYLIVKGIDATLDTITTAGVFKNRDQDNSNKLDYSAKLGYRKNRLNAFVSYKAMKHNTDLDKAAFRDDDNREIYFNRDLIDFGLNYKLNAKLNISYSGGYTIMNRTDIDDSSIVDLAGSYDHQYNESFFDGSLFLNDLVLKADYDKIKFLAGIAYEEESMNNSGYIYSYSNGFLYENRYDLDSLKLATQTKSAFAHFELGGDLVSAALKPLNIALGLRFSSHSTFGNVMNWEVNPSWKLSSSSLLYLSYSTGFNAPSLYRLYSPDVAWGAVVTRGNPLLKPEYSKSFELGFKKSLGDKSKLSVAFFNNKIDNVIEYVYLWDKNVAIDSLGNDWMRNDYKGDTYINLSEQNIYGIEFFISTKLSEKIDFSGSYTFMNAVSPVSSFSIDTASTHGHHVQLFESGLFVSEVENTKIGLVRRPSSIVTIQINWRPTEKLKINFSSRFVGTRYDAFYNPVLGPYGALDNELLAGYALANLSARYELKNNLAIGFKIENLFDTKYTEINGFSTRGRGCYFNVRYLLKK
ncbi:MAG: TonB-dependent receptor [Bacteroidetes bacterium]|nr:TonB-dependent receptor [Bacteroidota bacterium]